MKRLDGQNALITAGGRRTGRALALALAAEGARVSVTYQRDRDSAEECIEACAELAPAGKAYVCDATDADSVARLVLDLESDFGPLDILVNAVGSFQIKNLLELTPQEWQRQIDGTVTAAFLHCRGFLPGMRRKGYGRVVNIADSGADHLLPVPNITPYMVGKTGVLILSKSLAAEVSPDGVTVNAISPGILENSITKPPVESIPVHEFTSLKSLSRSLLHLVDPEAGDLTGLNLKVGGGWNM